MTCISPIRELLTFWAAGTLAPDEAQAVADHLARCPDCRDEADDARRLIGALDALHLQPDEVVAVAAGEINPSHLTECRRCREEVDMLRAVNADLARPETTWRTRAWQTAFAAAAAILVTVVVVRQFRGSDSTQAPPPPTPSRQPAPARPVPPPPRLRAEKAPITLAVADVLVLRGPRSPRQRFLEELAAALTPYRQDDYGAAIDKLRALAAKYPDAPEPVYYEGVSLLLLERPAEAIAPLQIAARIMQPPEDAFYYLAVAQVNAGSVETGRAGLKTLCDAKTEISPRACAAQLALAGGRR